MDTDRVKFRGYCKKAKKYIVMGNIRDHLQNECDIIEQCTGLKDKNGVLIFEGDKIKWHCKKSFFPKLLNEYAEINKLDSINNVPSLFTSAIINHNNSIWVKSLHSDYKEPLFHQCNKYTPCFDIDTSEIVGNVHEED